MVFAQNRLDNDTNVFFLKRELEYILPQVFETKYADIVYQDLIPVSNEVSPGADSYTYRILDGTSVWKMIQDRADNLPRADVSRREVTMPIRMIGGSMAYTIDELEKANYANQPLQSLRADRMRRGYEEKVQQLAFWGDTRTNLAGFFNNVQVPILEPDTWFDSCTPDEMIQLLNYVCTYITDTTNMVEQPDSMLLPYPVYRIVSTTPRSGISDTTVLKFFLDTSPFIKNVQPVIYLETGKSSGNLTADRIIAYRRDPSKLQLHIPQPLTVLAPELRGLEYVVNGYGKVGGAALYYPGSLCYMQKRAA
jgi:hypothetical protein